jgi:hypothetical protein
MLHVRGACTDWTTKAENERPNCLILKALTLKHEAQTDLAANFWQPGSYQLAGQASTEKRPADQEIEQETA